MSFSFSFSGDDIEDEPDSEQLAEKLEKSTVTEQKENAADATATLLSPRKYSLQALLESLPSQVSYNYVTVPGTRLDGDSETAYTNTCVPRRSLFDIRQQLMAEADPVDNASGDDFLEGLQQGDLTSGIYEGGFKTWECALDLATAIFSEGESPSGSEGKSLHVIELGAGSAIPSLALLSQYLRNDNKMKKPKSIKFTLCDYNEEVLRLCTAVNVFLVAQLSQDANAKGPVRLEATKREENDMDFDLEDINQDTVNQCLQRLERAGITSEFISGAWGDEFLSLFEQSQINSEMRILASETIYSPESTKVFSRMIMDLLQRSSKDSKATIAAKKIYFGVGGSVQDFVDEVESLGGRTRTLLDAKDAGVGRIVIEVTSRGVAVSRSY